MNGIVRTIGLIILFGAMLPGRASAEGPGTAGSPLLRIGAGSRSAAMGDAYTGVAEGTETLFYNPAGLARIREAQVGFSHMEWLAGIRMESLSYGQEVQDGVAAAGNLMLLPMGGATRTLEDASGEYAGEAGMYSSSMNALSLGVGARSEAFAWTPQNWHGRLTAGTSLKIFTQNLDGNTSASAGLDLGLLYQRTPREPRLGLSLQNLGLLSLGREMPLKLRLGAGQGLFGDHLLVSGDYSYDREGVQSVAVGGEWVSRMEGRSVSLRGGGFSETASSTVNYSLGFGYMFYENGWSYLIDYAFVPYSRIGNTHRVTFTVDLQKR